MYRRCSLLKGTACRAANGCSHPRVGVEGWKVHVEPSLIDGEQILSFEHSEILAAYKKAKESGSYTNVLLYNGETVKHYALTDHIDYFAEGTEAYLYRNDFYSFVRAELKEHDPTLHEALVKGEIQRLFCK